jgi:hypothetical protein
MDLESGRKRARFVWKQKPFYQWQVVQEMQLDRTAEEYFANARNAALSAARMLGMDKSVPTTLPGTQEEHAGIAAAS